MAADVESTADADPQGSGVMTGITVVRINREDPNQAAQESGGAERPEELCITAPGQLLEGLPLREGTKESRCTVRTESDP